MMLHRGWMQIYSSCKMQYFQIMAHLCFHFVAMWSAYRLFMATFSCLAFEGGLLHRSVRNALREI